MEVTIEDCDDLSRVETRWRALENESACSFFASATWTFCRAASRFPTPVLLRVGPRDNPSLLALLNRRSARFGNVRYWLGESGDPALDDVFIEHNGPLIRDGRAEDQTATIRKAFEILMYTSHGASRLAGPRVVMSGIDASLVPIISSAGGRVRVTARRPAPRIEFIDLSGSYLDTLSANTRYQVRRSAKLYATRGRLDLARAEDLHAAHRFLDELVVLHQAYWTGRGQRGAFANANFLAFHRDLITRGFPRGEIDLLRVTAGQHVVGLLYNFRYRRCVYAYQSGFAYEAGLPQLKPGLTCHHLAIEFYRAGGAISYDFLGGNDRYKTSLANGSRSLVWLEATSKASLAGQLERLRNAVKTSAGLGRFTAD